MSEDDKDDLEYVEEYPVFNRVTSTFEWHKVPPEPPQQKYTTYSFEVEGGMDFIAGGFRVGNSKETKGS